MFASESFMSDSSLAVLLVAARRSFRIHKIFLIGKFYGAERDRTADLMLAKHALSQLSYCPDHIITGGPKWT